MWSNEKVIQEWKKNGISLDDAKNISTCDGILFSYKLIIGITRIGKKVVINYTGKNRVSQTTSNHVKLAEKYADIVEEPPE